MGDWIEPGQRPRLYTDRRRRVEGSPCRTSRAGRWCSISTPRTTLPAAPARPVRFATSRRELKKLGADVLGVSPDSIESHGKFRDKYRLNFPLLADEDHAVAEKYGAWREKNMYGKKSMGIQRSTFLIDAARQSGQGVEAGEGRRPR